MSTLEREIIEKFHQLQPAEKQRIRMLIEQETTTQFDYAAWMHDVEALRHEISASRNMIPAADVINMLCDIHDGEDE